MKVKDTPSAPPLGLEKRPGTAATASTEKAGRTEKVEKIEKVGKVEEAASAAPASETAITLDSAKRIAANQRGQRLRQLESQVKAGSYAPNASQIASQILASAELDARLRLILGGA